MSLASRIATVFPYPGVEIQIKKTVPDTPLSDGIAIESDQGYDIHFVFKAAGVEAVKHTDTLNLSNKSMQTIVESVVADFDEMMDQIRAEKAH